MRHGRSVARWAVLFCCVSLAGCPKGPERLMEDVASPSADEDARFTAAEKLARGIGHDEIHLPPTTTAEMLGVLEKEADGSDASRRARAYEALNEWAPHLPDTTAPLLYGGVDDSDAWARANAVAAAYRQFKTQPIFHEHEPQWNAALKHVIADLGAALRDPDPKVRARAAGLATDLESKAKDLVPALRALTQDPDHGVQAKALSALEQSGQERLLSVDEWISHCKSNDWQIRGPAGSALARIGADAVPRLTEIVRGDPDSDARDCAVWVLGLMGPAVSSVLPVLKNAAANDDSWSVRQDAASSVERVEGR